MAQSLHYLHATAILVAIWSIVAQLEWVAQIGELKPGGLLHEAGSRRSAPRLLRPALSMPGLTTMTVIRLAGAALLILTHDPGLVAIGFGVTVATAPVMPLGLDLRDGSDKMGLLVAVAGLTSAVGLWLGDPLLAFAGVLLAGGQLTLCYAISGISKLLRREWRDGSVLHMVMASESHGHPHGAYVARRSWASLCLCWALMLAEALFPLALLAPAPVLWGMLAVFLIFHIATAYLMGLNTFAWAFPAAFPAVLLLGDAVRPLVA